MALVQWEPFGDMDRFFENFPSPFSSRMGWDLAVDVYEDAGNVIAEMNLPGIDPKQVEVVVEDSHLRIAGSREETKEEKKKHYYGKEIRRGSFERIVRLPEHVDKNKTKAEYKSGVLKVIMPKAAQEKSGAVAIEVKD